MLTNGYLFCKFYIHNTLLAFLSLVGLYGFEYDRSWNR